MPSPIPKRDRKVFFVGAGLSCAFKLPNTPSLISETISFSRTNKGAWLGREGFRASLNKAFEFFYPDARNDGFMPDVVDFFSALRTYLDVGAGLAGTGFQDAPDLYRLLRLGIAHLLIERVRALEDDRLLDHDYLDTIVRPGNIIITSNWDPLIEHYAALRGYPLRLTSKTRHFEATEVYLLKLHGSIDWTQVRDSKSSYYSVDDFATLKELQFTPRPRRHALPSRTNEPDEIVRTRAHPVTSAWQRIRSRSREPYMVTMATGKADDLGPLRGIWRDAYRALSRAETLDIIGYSMPADDVEIRTMLRTGIQRGSADPRITVVNPSPDVHYRVRNLLHRNAVSDYLAVAPY